MLTRLLSVIIILFWLGSLGWLCAVIWAPPESRMTEINPREVYRVFFSWNDSTSMTLLENGARKGEIKIAGGSGVHPITEKFSNSLSLSGTVEQFNEKYGASTVELFWSGLLEFDEEIKLDGGEFSIRIPRQSLSAFMAFTESPQSISASAKVGDKEVFSFGGKEGEVPELPAAALPLSSFLGEQSLDPSSINWKAEARFGEYAFGGRNMRAYLLMLRAVDQDILLKVYLSEVGEPLRVTTELGFEAVSEILVPLDAYRKMGKSDQITGE